jgi:hypothetical protein
MRLSRSKISLAEEWHQSSWMRKAAVLRLGYTLSLPLGVILAKGVLSLESYVWLLKLTPGPTLMFMAMPCITVLLTEQVPASEDSRMVPWNSPNLSYVRQFFGAHALPSGAKMPSWAVGLNAFWGVATLLLFFPLLILEFASARMYGRVNLSR